MPRTNQNTKICSRTNSKCYNSVRLSLERGENKKYECNCLPGCDELSFSGEISSAPLTTTHFQMKNRLANFSEQTLK